MNTLARITTRRLTLEKYTYITTSTPSHALTTSRQAPWSSPRAEIRGISSAPAFGFNAPASRPTPSSQSKGAGENLAEEMPVASFRELIIGRKTKIFLFTVLGVFGTLETWFWVETIYRWWRGDGKEEK